MSAAARVKRVTLVVLMVALSGGAALAIVLLLRGRVGDTEARLIGTTGLLALFTLTGLCSAVPLERGILAPLGIAGMVASVAAFLVGLAYVWGLILPTEPADLRLFGVVAVAPTTIAWAALLTIFLGRSLLVTVAAGVTMAAVGGLAGVLVFIVVSQGVPGETLGRAAGVLAILAVSGTFLTPMLDKTLQFSSPPRATGFGPSETDGWPRGED